MLVATRLTANSCMHMCSTNPTNATGHVTSVTRYCDDNRHVLTQLRRAKKKSSSFTPDFCPILLKNDPWIVQPSEYYDEVDIEALKKKHS